MPRSSITVFSSKRGHTTPKSNGNNQGPTALIATHNEAFVGFFCKKLMEFPTGSLNRWDRWYAIPQLAVYTTYIPLIYCLLGDYISPTTYWGNQETPLKTHVLLNTCSFLISCRRRWTCCCRAFSLSATVVQCPEFKVLHLKLAPNEIGDSHLHHLGEPIRETWGVNLCDDHPKSFFFKNEKIHCFFLSCLQAVCFSGGSPSVARKCPNFVKHTHLFADPLSCGTLFQADWSMDWWIDVGWC